MSVPGTIRSFGLKPALSKSPWAPVSVIILVAALATGIIFLGLFIESSTDDDSSSPLVAPGSDDSDDDPEGAGAFGVSSGYFGDAYEALRAIGSVEGWGGDSGMRYGTGNAGFADLMRQVAETNQQVDATVQTEGEQVEDGRETLGNVCNDLELAMPVSESLYFSGPAGPALSYHFQLAVANSAIGTGTDTANTMHENAQKHAERLSALAQQYDKVLRSICPADTAGFADSAGLSRVESSNSGTLVAPASAVTGEAVNAAGVPQESQPVRVANQVGQPGPARQMSQAPAASSAPAKPSPLAPHATRDRKAVDNGTPSAQQAAGQPGAEVPHGLLATSPAATNERQI